jgi:hypothetical protein
MPPSPSDPLAAQRADCAARLEQRLTAGDAPLTELRELQERLRVIDGVLAERRAAQGRRPARVLAPMLAVAVALTLAAVVPVPAVPLSLEVHATSVTLTMAHAATLGPVALAGDTRIEGVTAVDSPDASLARAFAAERADTLVLRGDLLLRTLQVPAGARLTVQAAPDSVLLQVESPRDPTVAQFELRGRTALLVGDAGTAEQRDYAHGEWLQLRSAAARGTQGVPPPVALTLGRGGAGEPARLADLQPAALRFAERRDSGDAVAAVSSSLEGGTLTLPESGTTVALTAGDWLEVDGLRIERCDVVAGTPLLLKLNGSARGLRLRVGDFERSLKPSWLEYTARHHTVQLLWSAAAVLWGAWAWTRKQFGGAP